MGMFDDIIIPKSYLTDILDKEDEQEIFDDYRQRWSYKFWTKVERCCQKFTVMARNRHLLPYDLRKTAYKASGRLEEDPDCLKWYQDI